MRLLHTTRLKLTQFTESRSSGMLVDTDVGAGPEYTVPRFAILSHTWEDEEVVFEDIQGDQSIAKSKFGWEKIRQSCELARNQGYEWIWIDTCCIDKTSSAELSEAINSMFRWYRMSGVCYAFLSDADGDGVIYKNVYARGSKLSTGVRKLRWYSRGWTLQELIAPKRLEFYNKDWAFIGTRKQHKRAIAEVYGIDEYALDGGDLSRLTVARRMAWLSSRETTRVEDLAYCMLGIFDVNMPLLYGEGSKAFVRLQEEILKLTDDQTIFSWREQDAVTCYREDYGESFERSGLLADSPRLFATSIGVARHRIERSHRPHAMSTSKGIMVQLLICQDDSYGSGEVFLAALDCPIGRTPGVMAGIRLRRTSRPTATGVLDTYVRVDIAQIFHFAKVQKDGVTVDISGFDPTVEQQELVCLRMRTKHRNWKPTTIYVTQAASLQLPPSFRLLPPPPYYDHTVITIHEVYPVHHWDVNTWVLQPPAPKPSTVTIGVFDMTFCKESFFLLLGVFVTPLGAEPWCKIIRRRPGRRTSMRHIYQHYFPRRHYRHQYNPDTEDDMVEDSLRYLTQSTSREDDSEESEHESDHEYPVKTSDMWVDYMDGGKLLGFAVIVETKEVSGAPVYIVHFRPL